MTLLSFASRLLNKKSIRSGPNGALSPKKTVLYWPNWSVYQEGVFPFDKIPFEKVTHVCYAFFKIDAETGQVTFSDQWADLELPLHSSFDPRPNRPMVHGMFASFYQMKMRNRGTKTLMSIGGWSMREAFKRGVESNQKVTKFINSTILLFVQFGFDGIDLDWEYPEGKIEAKILLFLIIYFRQALNKLEDDVFKVPRGSLLLTIAAPALEEKLKFWNLKEMNKHVSFFNLMAYDFAGEWSDRVEYHSNLFKTHSDQLCADDAVNYLISNGIDSEKIILGMPAYGRSFTHTKGYGQPFNGVGKDPQLEEPGYWRYSNLPILGSTEGFDNKAVSAYCFDGVTFIGYDNTHSAQRKAQYVIDKGLGGGMWWEASSDNFNSHTRSLLHSFVNALGGEVALDKSKNCVGVYKSEYLRQNRLP